MTRRRWGLIALGLALLGWVIGGEWVSIHAHVPENHFIDALPGLSFLVAGLVALDRRPGHRIGWLMLAYALVSYVGNWGIFRCLCSRASAAPSASSWAGRSSRT